MTEETIGARVLIDPGTSVATLNEVTDAAARLNAMLEKLGLTSEAAMAKVDKSAAGAAAASGKAGVAAGDAALVGAGAVGAHTKALKEAGVASDELKAKSIGLKETITGLAGGSLGKIGKDSIIGAVGIAGESIDQYIKYQKAITQLSTQAGLPANRLPAIFQGGIGIAKQTGLDFNDVANQLYRIVSATSGLKETNKQILALGKSAADIAVLFQTAPGAPTEQVARLFGSLANAGRSGKLQQTGGSPAGIGALLNAAVGTGDIRGQDLIGALGRGVLQAGEAVHAKLPDILTWLDLSTRLGAQPSTSGTLIAHSLQQLSGGTVQAKHVEAMAGVTPSEMANLIQTKGIGAAFTDLSKKLQNFNPLSYYPSTVINGQRLAPGKASAEGQFSQWLLASPQQTQEFFNGTASAKVKQEIASQLLAKMFGGARQEIPALTAIENPKLWDAVEAQIRAKANAGTYNKDLTRALGTPSQQLDEALRSIQGYSIELGKDLTPALLKFVHGIVGAAQWLSSHRAVFDTIAGTLGAFLGLSAGVYVGGKIINTLTKLKEILQLLGTTKLASALGVGGAGGLTGKASTAANTTALTENTAAVVRLADVMAVADAEGGRGAFYAPGGKSGSLEEFYAGSNGARVVGSGEAALTDAEFYGMPAMTKVGESGLSKFAAMGIGGRLLPVGLATVLATQLYNSFAEKPLSKVIGKSGASTVGDTITGAGIGTLIEPGFGTAVGAAMGAAFAQRSHIAEFLHGAFGKSETSGDHPNTRLRNARSVFANNPVVPKPLTLSQQTLKVLGKNTKDAFGSNLIDTDESSMYLTSLKYGANSKQTKQQENWLVADAKKIFGNASFANLGKFSPGANGLAALQLDLTRAQDKQENKAISKQTLAGFNHAQAQTKLFFDSLNGGSLADTRNAIAQTKANLKQVKTEGGSLDHVKGIEAQLKEQLDHQKTLEEDTKKVAKTSDVQHQTTALVDALTRKDTTQNSLLQQILNTLQKMAPGTIVNTKSKAART